MSDAASVDWQIVFMICHNPATRKRMVNLKKSMPQRSMTEAEPDPCLVIAYYR